jgi:hypothetical protein
MGMRWYILRTLLLKEWRRHAANRGRMVLVALLIAAAMILSLIGASAAPDRASLGLPAPRCYVDYWRDGPWIEHLRRHVPPELEGSIEFRAAAQAPTVDGQMVYPHGAGAIQIRTGPDQEVACYKVWIWRPGANAAVLAPYEAWFWRESHCFREQQAARAFDEIAPAERSGYRVERLEVEHSRLEGPAEPRSSLATALVLFGLFFVCVYLLPTVTGEERERGTLLAVMLSPASAGEIVAARFMFYPVIGLALAALLAGISEPGAPARPFFWLALVVATAGSMGVGLTVASLAGTQRTAGMLALSYLLVVSILLVICQRNEIPGLPWLFLEYHGPRMVQAALSGTIRGVHWWHLAASAFLAAGWIALATVLFRRQGWQ